MRRYFKNVKATKDISIIYKECLQINKEKNQVKRIKTNKQKTSKKLGQVLSKWPKNTCKAAQPHQ